MSVTVIARLFPQEGSRQAMLDAMATPLEAIRAEPGCERFAAHTAPDGSVVLIELWSSREALAAHSRGTAIQELRAARAPFESAAATVEVLEPEPLGGGPKATL